jgi:hypothetical protein
MHPREFANGEAGPPCHQELTTLENEADKPVPVVAPRTRFHRLRTTLKASHRLRLPRPLLLGDANTELHCMTRTPRIQSHQRKCGNGPARSARSRAGFTS